MRKQLKTSWEASAKWYEEAVGEKGHYYHEKVIFPKLLPLMELKKEASPKVLDLACGQAVLARHLPEHVQYVGVDISKSLIQAAKGHSKNSKQQFFVSDITKEIRLPMKDFTHACIILALQNLQDPLGALKNAASYLKQEGQLSIILNHPCFRIPRHTHWGIDESKKLEYRRIDSYLKPLQIPIQTHPGKEKSTKQTWSFHFPLSTYSKWLHEAGFVLLFMEEWISDKKSTGGHARMENRAREEFPLFLTLICQKRASTSV